MSGSLHGTTPITPRTERYYMLYYYRSASLGGSSMKSGRLVPNIIRERYRLQVRPANPQRLSSSHPGRNLLVFIGNGRVTREQHVTTVVKPNDGWKGPGYGAKTSPMGELVATKGIVWPWRLSRETKQRRLSKSTTQETGLITDKEFDKILNECMPLPPLSLDPVSYPPLETSPLHLPIGITHMHEREHLNWIDTLFL